MPLNGRGDQIRWVEVEPQYVFHEVNAYRDGDDVVVDVSHHPDMFRSGTGLGENETTVRRWHIGVCVAGCCGPKFSVHRSPLISSRSNVVGRHCRCSAMPCLPDPDRPTHRPA